MKATDQEKRYRKELFKAVGAYLSERRENAGLTQSAIAKSSGYSSQFISNIECGSAFPPAPLLTRMIEEYGISQDEFLEFLMSTQMDYYRNVYFPKTRARKRG